MLLLQLVSKQRSARILEANTRIALACELFGSDQIRDSFRKSADGA